MPDDNKLTVELEAEKTAEFVIDDKPEVKSEPTPTSPDVKAPEVAPVVVEVEPAPEAPAKPAEPDPAVAELRAQLDQMTRNAHMERQRSDNERSLREEAEANAVKALEVAEARRYSQMQAQAQAISNAIAAEKADAESLKQQLRSAREGQDIDRETEIGMKLGEIGARIAQLKDGKDQLEVALKAPPRKPILPASNRERLPERRAEPQPQPQQPPTSGDPVEDFIQRLSPRTQGYLRARDRNWVADERSNTKLRGAHQIAIADGHNIDSDTYFEKIDEIMGYKTKADPVVPAAPVARRAAVAAAPVTHKGATNPSAVNGKTVTLTPRQQQAAKDLGIPLAEYAKRVYEMNKPTWGGPKFGQNN